MSRSLPLVISSLNEAGFGVGQKAGQWLTVARTAPGDHVTVGPPRDAGRWSSAELMRVVRPGPDRVEPGCQGFVQGCGGCQWLHLAYPAQVAWKEKNLAGVLRSRAGYTGPVHPMISMARPEAYRNKLSLKNVSGRLVFVPEFDGTSLAPRDCLVQTPVLQAAWARLRALSVPAGVEQLHLRSNAAGQVGLHAFVRDGVGLDAALGVLREACPGAVGLGVTSRRGYRVAAGAAALAQTIGATTWLIPHNGFFQTNQTLAGELLALVRRELGATGNDRVLDLYCGAGFFGLALAPEAREVVGIEENPQSVEAATASAAHSGIGNARFLAGDLGRLLATLPAAPAETAVVDPPREGLLPEALRALVARAPQRIVYVSCYPPSLARDYKVLARAGWRGTSCTPIDMFPHTSHVEAVLTLQR